MIQPVVWLLEGDAAQRRLGTPAGHADALRLEGHWSPRHPLSPWIELLGRQREGRTPARRLRDGPKSVADPDDPLLPDPAGAFAAIGRWVERVARQRPVHLVLHDVPIYGRDSLDLLMFLARFLDDVPVTFVLVYNGPEASLAWRAAHLRLSEEIGVWSEQRPPAWQFAPPRPVLGSTSLGIRACRGGAVHDGARILGSALQAYGGDCQAWQTLAMAALWLGEDRVVGTAVRQVLDSRASARQKARALRTWILSMRRTGDMGGLQALARSLDEMGSSAREDQVQQAWRCIDQALAIAAIDPDAHQDALDRLLDMPPGDVPAACLATGLVWRATAAYFHDDLVQVAALLARALDALTGMCEITRTQHVRTRYGMTLATLGCAEEAAHQLGVACREAVSLGHFDVAAVCAAEAAVVPTGTGGLAGTEAVGRAGWKADRIWRSPVGRAALRLYSARKAFSDDRPADAHAMANALLQEVVAEELHLGEATIRFLCEAAYVQADAAHATGEDWRSWARAGLEWAQRAPLEDRPLLLARGQLRLNRPR